MGVFLLTTAVIVFMLGLVSEQIALLRMEQRTARGGMEIDRQED
jgi:predicted ABC-type ATPase